MGPNLVRWGTGISLDIWNSRARSDAEVHLQGQEGAGQEAGSVTAVKAV